MQQYARMGTFHLGKPGGCAGGSGTYRDWVLEQVCSCPGITARKLYVLLPKESDALYDVKFNIIRQIGFKPVLRSCISILGILAQYMSGILAG